MKIFAIDGYFVDDNTEFEGYLVAEYDEVPDGWEDDDFFFFGLSELEIQDAIKTEEHVTQDFVITAYEVVKG